MKHTKHFYAQFPVRAMLAAVLAALCMLSSCSLTPKKPAETDTQPSEPIQTETTAPKETKPVTEEQTQAKTEPTAPIETEPMTETEPIAPTTEAPVIILTPVDDTPKNPPKDSEEETEAEETLPLTSGEETAVPEPPEYHETPKLVIDLTDQVITADSPITGQLVSAQSPYIKLVVNYSLACQGEGEYLLGLDVGLSCYELFCSEKPSGGTITVDGVSRTFASPAVAHGEHKETYIPFFTQTYNCTGNLTASIDVTWAFNGTYGTTEIGTLNAGGILQWGTAGECCVPSETDPAVPTPPAEAEAETDDMPMPETETEPIAP